jgi:prepilin-type N-terminal cleavage/methylation domain-containing protein
MKELITLKLDSKGFTLIEVVVSIVILGIIFISFFAFFIQSNKTTIKSDMIMNATYASQQEMERIYVGVSNASSEQALITQLGYPSHSKIAQSVNNESIQWNSESIFFLEGHQYTREDTSFSYTLTVRSFQSHEYQGFYNFRVDVIEKKSGNQAQMESVYALGGV